MTKIQVLLELLSGFLLSCSGLFLAWEFETSRLQHCYQSFRWSLDSQCFGQYRAATHRLDLTGLDLFYRLLLTLKLCWTWVQVQDQIQNDGPQVARVKLLIWLKLYPPSGIFTMAAICQQNQISLSFHVHLMPYITLWFYTGSHRTSRIVIDTLWSINTGVEKHP